jgi:integrase
MPRTLKDSRLDSREARLRLKVRGKPYARLIEPKLHLLYRRLAGRSGSWAVRRYVGAQTYIVEALGAVADDYSDANGHDVLEFKQAQRRALESKPKVATGALTVADALKAYLADLAHRGKSSTQETRYRVDALITPQLGEIAVEALTSEQIRAWHAALAKAPGRHTQKADEAEAQRRRRSSANRTLTVLRAALNLAYREGKVPSDAAWRRVRAFKGVDAARLRYLTVDEAKRLINAASGDFRALVTAALQTGMRYGELGRLRASDFNADSGTVTVRQSKSGKSRHVVLTDEGVTLFRRWRAGKAGDDLLFTRGGEPWGKSNQDDFMRAACARAHISPPANFHALRHSYASLSIMAGAPLLVIARNLGHRDTRMVEHHYGHLAPSYTADTIRKTAPRFGIEPDDSIVPLPVRP